MITLAQRIEELRRARNVSRQELAAALGLPKMSIEKFETGRLTPNREQQSKIAKYFDVSLPYLRGEVDDPGSMASWLSGNLPSEEPVQAPVSRKAVRNIADTTASSVVASSGSGTGGNALFQSDSFKAILRQTVLEVLRSPEGEKLLSNAIRKELSSKR